jgi:hypothetical protein
MVLNQLLKLSPLKPYNYPLEKVMFQETTLKEDDIFLKFLLHIRKVMIEKRPQRQTMPMPLPIKVPV